MLIQGSTMGVTSLTRQIRDYDGEDTEVLDFAKKQLKREEKNIDEIKKIFVKTLQKPLYVYAIMVYTMFYMLFDEKTKFR